MNHERMATVLRDIERGWRQTEARAQRVLAKFAANPAAPDLTAEDLVDLHTFALMAQRESAAAAERCASEAQWHEDRTSRTEAA